MIMKYPIIDLLQRYTDKKIEMIYLTEDFKNNGAIATVVFSDNTQKKVGIATPNDLKCTPYDSQIYQQVKTELLKDLPYNDRKHRELFL